MTQYPVLDDNTVDASIIGHAANATEAAEVFAAWRGSVDEETAFIWRHDTGTDFKEIAPEEIASGHFEPMW